jgi:hypothetical protein
MGIVSFGSKVATINIFAVGDALENKYGWHIERQVCLSFTTLHILIFFYFQNKPDCIHLSLMPGKVRYRICFLQMFFQTAHAPTKEKFVTDLKEALQFVKQHPEMNKQGNER